MSESWMEDFCSCKFSGEKNEKEENYEDDLIITNSDVLDCPICCNPLTIPVYQCMNGHVICSSCYPKIYRNRCPSCSQSIGQKLRNNAIEKVIESAKVACKFRNHGCKEMVQYSNKEEHSSTCRFSPHSLLRCPIPSCNFAGLFPAWQKHINESHRSENTENYGRRFSFDKYFDFTLEKTQSCFILRCQEKEEHDLFVLNNFRCVHRNAITISRAAPPSLWGSSCEIMAAKCGDISKSVSLHSAIDCVQEKVYRPPAKKTLFVPDGYDVNGKLYLRLRISKCMNFGLSF